MREARFSRSSYVRLAKGSILSAISHVWQTFCKHGWPNPSLDNDGKTGFLLQQELRAFKKADPAEKHQKAIPMLSYQPLQNNSSPNSTKPSTNSQDWACSLHSDLVNILKSCRQNNFRHNNFTWGIFASSRMETSSHTHIPTLNLWIVSPSLLNVRNERTSTTQSHRNHQVIWCSAPWGLPLGWSYKGTDSNIRVSAYISNGVVEHVASAQVINALWDVVGAIGETQLGIANHKIGTHSIRSGAAMAMYLGECLVYTIMLISRWSSNAFLRYIWKQVMEFSHNVSKKMLCFKNYKHVPNYDHRIAANDPRVCNNPNNAKMRRNVGGDASRQSRLPAFTQFN